MSDELPPLIITEQLRKLLRDVHKHLTPPKEQTLFSLGGRGYYENPASDILRFFLTPSAEHGFKALFLRVFLDCLGVDSKNLRFDGVTVEREKGRIDLLIKGTGWILVIENKVRHIQNNPWDSYETHARRGGEEIYFAVLSPEGEGDAPEKWKPISYKNYCEALRKAFAEAVFNVPYSKWLVFAREFIIHLETELYATSMTLEKKQIDFVEQHLSEIAQVKRLSREYTESLLRDLEKRLGEAIPEHRFGAWEAAHALKCKDNERHIWEFDFQTPEHTTSSGKFGFTVWRRYLTDEQRLMARDILSGMSHDTEGRTWDGWSTVSGFDDRTTALNEMCRITNLLSELWQVENPPSSSALPHIQEATSTNKV